MVVVQRRLTLPFLIPLLTPIQLVHYASFSSSRCLRDELRREIELIHGFNLFLNISIAIPTAMRVPMIGWSLGENEKGQRVIVGCTILNERNVKFPTEVLFFRIYNGCKRGRMDAQNKCDNFFSHKRKLDDVSMQAISVRTLTKEDSATKDSESVRIILDDSSKDFECLCITSCDARAFLMRSFLKLCRFEVG